MSAVVVSLDGSQNVQDSVEARLQTIEEANSLGEELADKLVQAGAEAILKDINTNRPAKE
jgi:hydroxymethylbilane synthase